MTPFIKRFFKDEGAATIIEFAIVAPVFFLLILGIIEFGLIMFSSIALESIVMMASRAASIGETQGSGCVKQNVPDFISCYVKVKGAHLIHGDRINVIAVPYGASKTPDTVLPDLCLDDNPPDSDHCLSSGSPCKSYMEVNGKPKYQCAADVQQSNGGGAGDLVQITAYYPWFVQVPLLNKFIGCQGQGQGCQKGMFMIKSSTIVKNEPFPS